MYYTLNSYPFKNCPFFKKYHKYVKHIYGKIPNICSKKWKHYLQKLPISHINNKIKLLESEYVHSNLFQSRFTDAAIFVHYLKNKYNKLYLPEVHTNIQTTPDWSFTLILPDDSILKNTNDFPWLIIWNNSENYWIHPKLNKLIEHNKVKYDYAFIILSLRLPNDGLHATLILYDFKRNLVERFDPYGNTTTLDRDIDKVLKDRLTTGTNIKYISPSVYFPVSGFQSISDENNDLYQKPGDFGGYCLAWCLWYVEHRIINSSVDPQILVRKTLNRFMEMKIKPMEYIRNYANSINKYRLNYMHKIGIPNNITSNEQLPLEYDKLLNESILKL